MVMSERDSRIMHNLEERDVRDKIRRQGSQMHKLEEEWRRKMAKKYKEKFGEDIGKFSKSKYWIHKQPNWGQLTTKSHPFDIRNTRNRKFPKIKRF